MERETRLPTTKELIDAITKILVCYHLIIEGKATIKKWDDINIPEILKGVIAMAYAMPIGTLIQSDPLLSQHREKVYNALAEMVDMVSTTKSKEGEEE